MSTFKEKLSKCGKAVLNDRAQNIYDLTKIEEERFINDRKMDVIQIKAEITKMNDLAIKTTDSLVPGSNNFNPHDWVLKRHQLESQLREAIIDYKTALMLDKNEFPDDESGVDSATNIDSELDKYTVATEVKK